MIPDSFTRYRMILKNSNISIQDEFPKYCNKIRPKMIKYRKKGKFTIIEYEKLILQEFIKTKKR